MTTPPDQPVSEGLEVTSRFGHHPDPAIDFCIEVEEIESLAEGFRLGHKGDGQEAEHAALPDRVEFALDFRARVDENCLSAQDSLRTIATAFGFKLCGEQGYAGQPIPRQALSDDTVREQLPPLRPYPVQLVTVREQGS